MSVGIVLIDSFRFLHDDRAQYGFVDFGISIAHEAPKEEVHRSPFCEIGAAQFDGLASVLGNEHADKQKARAIAGIMQNQRMLECIFVRSASGILFRDAAMDRMMQSMIVRFHIFAARDMGSLHQEVVVYE